MPGVGWVAAWSEQDGPGPQWYRLRDAKGSQFSIDYETYRRCLPARIGGTGVGYPVGYGGEIPRYLDNPAAFVALDSLRADHAGMILARLLNGALPYGDVYLDGSRDMAWGHERARVHIRR